MERYKKAVKIGGSTGLAGAVAAAIIANPEKAWALAEKTLESNYGPVIALAMLFYPHLVSIQDKIGRLGDVMEAGFNELKSGHDNHEIRIQVLEKK